MSQREGGHTGLSGLFYLDIFEILYVDKQSGELSFVVKGRSTRATEAQPRSHKFSHSRGRKAQNPDPYRPASHKNVENQQVVFNGGGMNDALTLHPLTVLSAGGNFFARNLAGRRQHALAQNPDPRLDNLGSKITGSGNAGQFDFLTLP